MTEYELLQDLEALYPDRHDWQRVGEFMPAQEYKDGYITIKFNIQKDSKMNGMSKLSSDIESYINERASLLQDPLLYDAKMEALEEILYDLSEKIEMQYGITIEDLEDFGWDVNEEILDAINSQWIYGYTND